MGEGAIRGTERHRPAQDAAHRGARGRLSALVGVLLLGGCMVGPNFQAPPAPPVSGYTVEPRLKPAMATDVTGGAPQSFVTALDVGGQWWREFNSPQINAFVEEAVRNHPDVRAAQYALRAARETALQVRGQFLPQVTGNVTATREQITAASGGTTGAPTLYNLYETTVDVSYTLDVFGGIRRQVESADAQAQYQRFEMEATYLTLIANVITSAITDASLRDQIAATQAIVEAETDQLRRVQRQFEVGAVS
ncbi:MAG: histidine kinase, partial [Starkeya sp.]|nr:histidine kinase [Starkeya sp.]